MLKSVYLFVLNAGLGYREDWTGYRVDWVCERRGWDRERQSESENRLYSVGQTQADRQKHGRPPLQW